jgi:hypothetical protein
MAGLPLPYKFYFMRGSRTFNDLINNSGLNTTSRKGRNDNLVNRRNECLFARYYYYGYYKNKCYEEMLKLLGGEFFLSPIRVARLIQNNTEQVLAIKQRNPSLTYFSNRWPHLKW